MARKKKQRRGFADSAQRPKPAQERTRDPSDDRMSEEERKEYRKAVLGNTVMRRIKEAQTARAVSGIEDIWRDNEDQYNSIDEMTIGFTRLRDPAQSSVANPDNRSRVFLNITQPKTDSAVARVSEMLVPNDDKPWEAKPTPIPELAEAMTGDEDRMVKLGDGTEAPAKLVAKVAMEKAEAKAEAMGTQIEDWFVEGAVYGHLRAMIRDAGQLGSGVIKGPIPVARKSRRWSIQQGIAMLAQSIKTVPTAKCVSPWDLFPDPGCGDNIHNGSFIAERDFLTARQLRDLAQIVEMDGSPAYDRRAIAQALREGPPTRGRDSSEGNQNLPGETISESEVFEVYYYYGDCLAEDLMAMNVKPEMFPAYGGPAGEDGDGMEFDDELMLTAIPAIVTMLNDRPIKAVINPLETGEFPFDVFTWHPVRGQVWGRGIPHKMATAQRGVNAALRRTLENAGISAGPQIVMLKGGIEPVNKRYEVVGPKLWSFTPNAVIDDVRKAMAVFDIPSTQEQLMAIIEFFLRMADELTNLPMLLQGMQGGAPNLLGAMKMMESNANSPLRVIAKQFDDQVIGRMLNRFNDWGMQDPNVDEKCKGDTRMQARGSTALVQREIAREFLMMLYPVSDDPKLRIDKAKLAMEMARANGYNLASVQYTDAEWEKLEAEAAQRMQPSDPRIEAANIRNQGLREATEAKAQMAAQDQQFRAREAAQDRALQAWVKELEREIQVMELASDQDMSLAGLKAMLAKAGADLNARREEMQFKLNPANTSGLGV